MTACHSSIVEAGSGTGTDLSGPPVFSEFWGARLPRVCSKLATPPNPSQAAALVQCSMDVQTREYLLLVQNPVVSLGPARPMGGGDVMDQIDVTSKVYTITGSAKYYNCDPINDNPMHNRGKNCTITEWPKADGHCWKTITGTWKCSMAGPRGQTGILPHYPGPTTY